VLSVLATLSSTNTHLPNTQVSYSGGSAGVSQYYHLPIRVSTVIVGILSYILITTQNILDLVTQKVTEINFRRKLCKQEFRTKILTNLSQYSFWTIHFLYIPQCIDYHIQVFVTFESSKIAECLNKNISKN
jgi:hypothetical protein